MRHNPRAAHIFQINTSAGGVPKLPCQQSEIHVLGLVGDAHADENHGGVDRAVCLYPVESILDLQDEGHPIYPGAMGENLTVAGLDWAAIMPGTRLRLGEEALVEVRRYTAPCSNLIPYFLGGDYSRVSEKAHPGWSRVYARVLQPGAIRVGDRIRVE